MRLYWTLLFVLVVMVSASCTPPAFDRNYGVAFLGTGDYDSAIVQFKKAVSKEPNNSLGHFWLGKAYFDKGLYADAVTHLKTATQLQPENAYHLLMLGKAYIKSQRYQEAISALNKAIGIEPTESTFYKELGYCYILTQDYDEGITALKMEIELSSENNAVAYNNLGYAYGQNKQYDEAFRAFRKAIKISPQDAEILGTYGFFLLEKRDYTAAIEQYKKAISLRPNSRKYVSQLGNAYYGQGEYADALEAVNKAISQGSIVGVGASVQVVKNYPVVASVFESGSADRAGVEQGDIILKIDGESTKRWTVQEVVTALRGQEGAGVSLTIKRGGENQLELSIVRARIILPEARPFFAQRSFVRRHMGKYDESLQDAEKVYGWDSANQGAQLALGAACLDQGRYSEAVELLSQVKEGATARVLEATAYAKQGDFVKAVEIYTAIPIEDLSPESVPLASDRAALLDALVPYIASKKKNASDLEAKGEYGSALVELGGLLKIAEGKSSGEICGLIARIVSINPRLSQLPEEARKYALRGDMLTEGGKFADAVAQYRKAVQAAPYIASLYFNTAMIHGELKAYSQATRHMKIYLQLAPEAPNARAAQDQIYKWEFMLENGE